MLAELEILDWLQRLGADNAREVLVGIGDDAAVLELGGEKLLVTTDMLTEGTHFTLDGTDLRLIGRKAVAVNLSDIAAMGGSPIAAFLALAARRGTAVADVQRILEGAVEICREFNCALAGGDLNGTDGPVTVCVTLIGRSGPAGPILRRGARPGDVVFVTGRLGGSLSGKHLRFVPRLKESRFLVDHGPPSALIDLSDGLALDAHRIAAASNCRIVLDADAIPLSHQALQAETPLDRALYDGEDFELLGCMQPQKWDQIRRLWSFETAITAIGVVEAGAGVYLRLTDGSLREVEQRGYDHLARR